MYIFIALLIQGTLSVMEIVKMPGLMDHMLLDMKEKWHDRAKQSHYWDIMQKDVSNFFINFVHYSHISTTY